MSPTPAPNSTQSPPLTATSLVRLLNNFGLSPPSSASAPDTMIANKSGKSSHGKEKEPELEIDNEEEEEEEVLTISGANQINNTPATSESQSVPSAQEGEKGSTTNGIPQDVAPKQKQKKGKGKPDPTAPPASSPASSSKQSSLSKLLRSSQHTLHLSPTSSSPRQEDEIRVITSWKMVDYAYKRDPCPFPTRARGLFTERITPQEIEGGQGEGKVEGKEAGNGEEEEYRIVARGYDKFFNVGEVSWTKVS